MEKKHGKGEGEEEEEEEEDAIPQTPIPQKWECLGSDLEIKEGYFKDKRPLVGICQRVAVPTAAWHLISEL